MSHGPLDKSERVLHSCKLLAWADTLHISPIVTLSTTFVRLIFCHTKHRLQSQLPNLTFHSHVHTFASRIRFRKQYLPVQISSRPTWLRPSVSALLLNIAGPGTRSSRDSEIFNSKADKRQTFLLSCGLLATVFSSKAPRFENNQCTCSPVPRERLSLGLNGERDFRYLSLTWLCFSSLSAILCLTSLISSVIL